MPPCCSNISLEPPSPIPLSTTASKMTAQCQKEWKGIAADALLISSNKSDKLAGPKKPAPADESSKRGSNSPEGQLDETVSADDIVNNSCAPVPFHDVQFPSLAPPAFKTHLGGYWYCQERSKNSKVWRDHLPPL